MTWIAAVGKAMLGLEGNLAEALAAFAAAAQKRG
jgi:hypothetical protein